MPRVRWTQWRNLSLSRTVNKIDSKLFCKIERKRTLPNFFIRSQLPWYGNHVKTKLKKEIKARWGGEGFFSALGRQKLQYFYTFKARLVYRESSRTTSSFIQINLVSETNKTKQGGGGWQRESITELFSNLPHDHTIKNTQ